MEVIARTISTKLSRLILFLEKKTAFISDWSAKLKIFLFKQLLNQKPVSVFKQNYGKTAVIITILAAAVVACANFGGKGQISLLEKANGRVIGGLSEEMAEIYEAGESPTPGNVDEVSANQPEEDESRICLINGASLVNSNPASASFKPAPNGIFFYRVKSGDTISAIAQNFKISSETVVWANNISRNRIFPGQELVILPVSGVLHEVKTGDTLGEIAKTYRANAQEISDFNGMMGKILSPGESLIIPNGQPAKKSALAIQPSSAGLPSYPQYYLIPTTGINWGEIHYKNAIDIANSCKTEVNSAAEGLVLEAGNFSGYGNYIKIQHPNDTETLYAHLEKILAEKGEYVGRGQLIGLMGNTGNSTGCHLHFEVRNAVNPFGN